MADLILWRHANASYAAQSDMERKLSEIGKKEAKKMAKFLQKNLLKNNLGNYKILTSEATRTKQTAKRLDEDYTPCKELNVGSSASDILEFIKWKEPLKEGSKAIVLVGHEPFLSEIVTRELFKQKEGINQAISFETASIVWLKSDTLGEVSLKLAITPSSL
ncbi:phosphohistidine phosphatase SixA [Helicobacter sp. 11S02629-2]|uniref:phosphohistidine phosphatase SixA n=1 Tax=Helicobacter sp. 11S02629-2 TaxID=1476195 RepID=UPI000BA6A3E0|nr:phosphohistidine phosphatase SixA [Helicobacter sp. 11S02629-2]PAF45562.1 phosphohistidine phosphatase SixA [Helicobacter sp. 11S02629-2]